MGPMSSGSFLSKSRARGSAAGRILIRQGCFLLEGGVFFEDATWGGAWIEVVPVKVELSLSANSTQPSTAREVEQDRRIMPLGVCLSVCLICMFLCVFRTCVSIRTCILHVCVHNVRCAPVLMYKYTCPCNSHARRPASSR